MSDVNTPAENQAEKREAAHKNQVKAEKKFASKLPKNSDAAQGQVAAPVNSPAGTSFPKEDREAEVGTVTNYQPGTAGDNADPERVFESSDPNERSTNLVSDEDTKAAEEAANDSRVELDGDGQNPDAKADAKSEVDAANDPDKGDLPAQSGKNKQPVNATDAGTPKK